MDDGETLEIVTYEIPAKIPEKKICPVCDNSFKDTSTLKVHMKTHANLRAYPPESVSIDSSGNLECAECGKRFALRAAFSNHVKIHSNPNSRAGKKLKYEQRSLPVPIETIDNGPESKEDEDKPFVHCFVCRVQTRCSRLGAHLQKHASALIRTCEETADIMKQFEVQLNPEDADK